jgi:sortase A
VSVLAPTTDNRLTLTTCHPRYSARQRLVVVAALVGEAAPPSPTAPPGPTAGEEQTPEQQERAQLEGADAGLSGDRAPARPAVLWGLLVALVWLATWALSRRWRKWPAYALGTPVFLAALYVFFENFSRLLPANF